MTKIYTPHAAQDAFSFSIQSDVESVVIDTSAIRQAGLLMHWEDPFAETSDMAIVVTGGNSLLTAGGTTPIWPTSPTNDLNFSANRLRMSSGQSAQEGSAFFTNLPRWLEFNLVYSTFPVSGGSVIVSGSFVWR